MWLMFLFGCLFGAGSVLLAFLYSGVRSVQAQRQALAAQLAKRQP